jgi:hypothetical protein
MATIFPSSPSVNDEYAGYRWNGSAWIIIGVDLTEDYATNNELSSHSSDTTSVHGISDTSLLATTSYVDTAESDAITTANAYSDSLATNYDAVGSSATAESNANTYTDTEISTHNSDTTNVHGIVDTSALATKTYADNAASTAAANLVDSAPSTLDTLNELAAALGDDPNFATTVTNSLAGKVENSGDTITGPLAVEVSSTDAALRVTQTGTGNALVVEDSASPDSTPFVVTAAGQVLVGSGGRSDLFKALPAKIMVEGEDYLSWISAVRNSSNNAAPLLVLGKSRGANPGGVTIVNSGDNVGQISFQGADGAGLVETAKITASVDGTPGTNDMPGRIEFSTTADGASSPTERMRINSAGNVGIGTSSPSYKLDVNGNARASNIMVIVDNGTDANYARPTGVGAVYWIGSAEPLNAAAYDMWWSG